jgi:VWFA-related protein
MFVTAATSGAGPQAEPPYRLPGVETARVLVEARVLDGRGEPIPDLGPADFSLEVDGRPVPLATAAWVDDAGAGEPGPAKTLSLPGAGPPRVEPPGRLVVLLFQKSFAGSRLHGLVRMARQADEVVGGLGPRDRVALAVFDSHLRLHLDFTRDREALKRCLSESALRRRPEPPPPGPFPSLAAHLDPDAALRAATPEDALRLVGEALSPLPGVKTVVMFGWGVGRYVGGVGVVMEPGWNRALAALHQARATVFSVDVTDADYHSLEAGLRAVAEDTGGLYVKSHDFPEAALGRVRAALAGHYVLTFDPPPGARGSHTFRLALVGRRGTVVSRTSYAD